jgi:hypothetical protein
LIIYLFQAQLFNPFPLPTYMDVKRHNKNLKSKINIDELLGTIWEYKGKMGGGMVRDGDLAIGNIDETWFQINVKIQHMDDFFI